MFSFSVWYGWYFTMAGLLLCCKYHVCYTVVRICVTNFTEICTKRVFIDCYIIPFLAIVSHLNAGLPRLKTVQAVLSEVKSKMLWVWGEQRQGAFSWSSMAWTKQPEVIGCVLVRYQLKDELRIPRWVKKERAQGGVYPSHPAGVLGSWRLMLVVLSGACSQLSIVLVCLSSSAGPGCHALRDRRVAQPWSAFAPRCFFRVSISSFGILYC